MSWTRTDFTDLPLKWNSTVHVVDVATGLEVQSQIVRSGNQRFLRVLASNVPSVGYKAFEIRPGAGPGYPNAATVTATTIENGFYRVTVAGDGAITSLIDKTWGDREVVRNIGGRVANDLGGNRTGTIVVENAGAVSVTLRATSVSPIPHITRITLHHNIKRVDVQNEITANFGDVKTWSYSFNIDTPNVWHEEVGAVIGARLLANGGHYSPRNARYDWLTLNHFVDIRDGVSGNYGVTLSNWDNQFMPASVRAVFQRSTPPHRRSMSSPAAKRTAAASASPIRAATGTFCSDSLSGRTGNLTRRPRCASHSSIKTRSSPQ